MHGISIVADDAHLQHNPDTRRGPIYRAHRQFIGHLGTCHDVRMKLLMCIILPNADVSAPVAFSLSRSKSYNTPSCRRGHCRLRMYSSPDEPS